MDIENLINEIRNTYKFFTGNQFLIEGEKKPKPKTYIS